MTLYPNTHILACAPSNTAADLITKRLARHVEANNLFRLCTGKYLGCDQHDHGRLCVPLHG